jgi:hypothetical protein
MEIVRQSKQALAAAKNDRNLTPLNGDEYKNGSDISNNRF